MDEQINEMPTKNELQNEKDELFEQLKNDILEEVKTKTDKKTLQWSSAAITVILVILTVASIVQTVESTFVLRKIKTGAASAISPAASNLQNLPDMVGGC